jgi:hypothetical protein
MAVWFRTTPPFSWAWPYIEQFGAATRLTDILLWSERAIQFVWAEAKASWNILKGMVRL